MMPSYSPPLISFIGQAAEGDVIKQGSPTPGPQTETSLRLVGNWATQIVGEHIKLSPSPVAGPWG